MVVRRKKVRTGRTPLALERERVYVSVRTADYRNMYFVIH
jgi:hypothetical protein